MSSMLLEVDWKELSMAHDIRCKRIIAGKTYHTETAVLLYRCEVSEAGDEEALFKTRFGAYFKHVDLPRAPDQWIEPLDHEQAHKWMESHCCHGELIEAEFGAVPEAGDPEARITLRIPDSLRARIAAKAADRNQSLNAWILRCLERYAAESETGQ